MRIHIAIVDSGVNSNAISERLIGRFLIDDNGNMRTEEALPERPGLAHGTNCALIIEKYCPEAVMTSIRILDNNGKGIVNKIQPALEWCLQNNIQLINLSLGTTHFQDKAVIRKVINYYANKGIIIVAASANSGYKTYPASFSNVVGVAAGERLKTDIHLKKQEGIDVIAPSEHEIIVEGDSYKLIKSNSYAAPYVTAIIGNSLREKSFSFLYQISYCPDWIGAAWVSWRCNRSKAEYYFKEITGRLEDCISMIDTIIVDTKEELEKYYNKGKHIVYLGRVPIKYSVLNIHFWSREIRIKQIMDSNKRASDINIPIIFCKTDKNQDVILYLSELKSCFGQDGYNVYTISDKAEGILYDLEFLPEELCNEVYKEKVHDFLYWQTYYEQADAILFGMNENSSINTNKRAPVADMSIEAHGTEEKVKVKIYCDGKLKSEETFESSERKVIGMIYRKMLKFFMEDANE